ncbi:MAG TPA: 4-(cytidine 5'-diphospho)-2-C-methyl-D-erythritol kinase [Chitinophagales bacterium]|nr:4-(cytidine 5'-diphospho)-2-C-methyl-D-erythritol kinase [Chitinophagales bacterium]
MISFPNCKINLGLRILSRRADGYHNLVSVFYPVPWCDALEFIRSSVFSFESDGLKIDSVAEDNLCVKAYRLLQKLYALPPVKMMLLKNIPMGAGLGGGSADGAFCLKMLNEYFELNLSDEVLKSHAMMLGSDCPFFMENKPMLVTGKGGQLDSIAVDLEGYYLLVVYPEIAINTSWAFNEFAKSAINRDSRVSIREFTEQLLQPVTTWKEFLVNDFEPMVEFHHPEIAGIRKQLYEKGALIASMTGSGSAVFGIFKEQPEAMPSLRKYRSFSGKL